ncbi:LURP-one-related family protein [Streptomyces sp. PTM05]|uniref:LURP-one-related family protein n=1 Tax=Streptantibioticus parmotrematis TaxID=2873249 RepID=A0ABS7QZE5_9ACTN|nr:LURP-one-related family protein [Streptantibioticus parmotrematis]MBY8888061.1 LURP-one-related family protein [Streptantibioticus parmotrematis]
MKYLVREKMFSIGDDFWIEDEHGNKAFYVDGKVLRLRETLVVQDPHGRELAVIHKKVISVRDAMTVERDGEVLVTVRKKLFTPFHDSYRAELASGDELEIRGDIIAKEYDIEYGDERLARISRKWFRLRDTYAIHVDRDDADPAMLIAIAVCVDRLVEHEHEKHEHEREQHER